MGALRIPRLAMLAWWPALFLSAAAIAAEQTVRALDAAEPRFWAALGAVQVLAFVGYAASSLPQWAGWIDATGGPVAQLERRLRIVQGVVIAILAGNLAFYGGFYYFALAEIVCFGAAAVASYGGDKFLSPLLSRLTGRVNQGG